MASHSLSIAKASLLASCLRPDATRLTRDELTEFHTLLDLTLSRCTPKNIQNTKSWLLLHILPSAQRTTAFGNYLTSLSKNIAALPDHGFQTRPGRRRLHILYLLHDVFHHLKHHAGADAAPQHAGDGLRERLPTLVAQAAEDAKAHASRRLEDLVRIWDKEQYCDAELVGRLRETLASGGRTVSQSEEHPEPKVSRELPWILPATHGDPSAPFFDLPAANLMPHILPNSSKPMRPDRIYALQLSAGPADKSLVNALKDFLQEVKSIEDPYTALEGEGVVADIDEMGQIKYRNDANEVVGDTYYGWSTAFCEKMKNRAKEAASHGRGRSRSSSRSRSPSRSPKKWRRYSSSRSRSRSRSAFRRRSPRSEARPHRQSPARAHPSRRFSPQASQSQSRTSTNQQPPPPRLPPQQPAHLPPTSPFPPLPGMQNALIPPRPPNWQGPWPPPPPPPPPNSLPFPPMPPQSFNGQGSGRR